MKIILTTSTPVRDSGLFALDWAPKISVDGPSRLHCTSEIQGCLRWKCFYASIRQFFLWDP